MLQDVNVSAATNMLLQHLYVARRDPLCLCGRAFESGTDPFPGFSSTKEGTLRLFRQKLQEAQHVFIHAMMNVGVGAVCNIRKLPSFPVCGPLVCVTPTSPLSSGRVFSL